METTRWERLKECTSLAEKFFCEREFSNFIKPDQGSVCEQARLWYEELKGVLEQLNAVSLNGGHDKTDSPSYAWCFRGQRRFEWGFHSTLARLREFGDMMPRDAEADFSDVEKRILRSAYDNAIGKGFTSLETLSVLQHHGAPTRLLDVSADWKIALWFACETEDSVDGRLFLLRVNEASWGNFPKASRGPKGENGDLVWANYKENFKSSNDRRSWLYTVWPVLVPAADPRMVAQKGFFLVGGLPSTHSGMNIYTTECKQCKKHLCDDPQHTYTTIKAALRHEEFREISSLAVRFGADHRGARFSRESVSKACDNEHSREREDESCKTNKMGWSAGGATVRVPAEYKPYIRKMLRDEENITHDFIYPPFAEVRRLLVEVAKSK